MLETSFTGKAKKTEMGFERCIEVCSKKMWGGSILSRQRKEPYKGIGLVSSCAVHGTKEDLLWSERN